MTTYLLCQEISAKRPLADYAIEYTEGEMAELFSVEERAALAKGEPISRTNAKGETTRFIDMTMAARLCLEA